MRDKGFNFLRYNMYTKNIFAKHYDTPSIEELSNKVELISVFEGFKNLESPMIELDILLKIIR
jgi:hypothetical protein